MKYASLLPLSAVFALSLLSILVNYELIPPGSEILSILKSNASDYLYLVIFSIILLESIIYVGFYFPGQFFSVILVVGANPKPLDVVYLTIAMVLAATIGSAINYALGRYTQRHEPNSEQPTKLKHLLLAMIHINSLAFFMFSQGSNGKSPKVVGLAGLLNLPYYLLLIAGTAILSEQVMKMAENTVLLFSIICVWLAISLVVDYRKWKQNKATVTA